MPDFNRLFSMFTQDHIANFSVFNGRSEITVWPRVKEKSRPVVKVIFNTYSLFQFKQILKKALESDTAKPVELGIYPFDPELKQPKFRASVTVGRDQEKAIYFEFKGDEHKEPIRFYAADHSGYRLNDQEIPKQHLTEIAVNALIDQIDHVFQAGTYLTKQAGVQGGGQQSNAGDPPPTPTTAGDDVPF